MARKVYAPATWLSQFRANELAVYGDVDTNPGSTLDDVVSRTALPRLVVQLVLQTLVTAAVLVERYDLTGNPRHYTASDWAAAMIAKRADARSWLVANIDGGEESALAASLGHFGGVPDQALARAFFDWFLAECSGRTVEPV